MKEHWIREGFSNYYTAKKQADITYEKRILLQHSLECLLPCEFRMEDDEEYYYFETGLYFPLMEKIDQASRTFLSPTCSLIAAICSSMNFSARWKKCSLIC